MKRFLIIFFILIFNTHAEEECKTEVLSKNTVELVEIASIPNCYTKSKLDLAKRGRMTELCDKCRKDFNLKLPAKTQSPNEIINKRTDLFINIAFDEYKKNLTNTMIEMAKLRTLKTTNSSFEKAINSCKFKKAEDFEKELEKCNPKLDSEVSKNLKTKLKDYLPKLSTNLAGELAQIVSQVELKDRSTGILDRSEAANTCFISEKDILHSTNITLEQSFTPDLLKLISESDLKPGASMKQLFQSMKAKGLPNADHIYRNINSHPLLSIYTRSPQDFTQMIKKLDPKTTENFTRELYSAGNGDQIDSRIADSCNKSFNSLFGSFCSPALASGDIKINPFKYQSLNDENTISDASELASSEALIEKNLNSFKSCEIYKSSGKIEAAEIFASIGSTVGDESSFLPFDVFRGDKYIKNFFSTNQQLCDIQSGKDSCSKDDLSFICQTYENYKKLQNESTSESRMANSSNKEINSLLRSLIGSPEAIPADVKKTLIAEGIIPKSDGTLIPQPDIPERRRPESYGNNQAFNQQGKIAGGSSNTSAQSALASTNRAPASSRSPYSTTSSQDVLPPNSPDSDLDEVNKEILRRLSDEPNNKPKNIAEAKKIVQEASVAKGTKLTDFQQTTMANRLMQPSPQPSYMPRSISGSPDSPNQASVSDTPSASEEYKKNGMNRALEEAANAKTTALSGQSVTQKDKPKDPLAPSSESSKTPEEISNVDLKVGEDSQKPLSEVLNNKLAQNDSETKHIKDLIRKKSSFILKINSIDFKVVFDEKSQLSLTREKGDKKEAERIRPQLESYLKKLRPTTSPLVEAFKGINPTSQN